MTTNLSARIAAWRPASAAVLALFLVALIASCTTTPWRGEPRALGLLDASVVDRFATPEAHLLRADAPIEQNSFTLHTGAIEIGGDELAFRYYVPKRAGGPAPLMLVLPILAGGEWITQQVCASLAQRGIASATIERRWKIFKRDETIEELEEKLVLAVRQQRGFLDWMSTREGVDPSRVGCFGMSIGGMLATMLAAVEPRIDCSVICLAGGDFARLAIEADEIQVERWVKKRCEADGIDARELQARIRASFSVDPLAFAPALDPSRVLFVAARFDGVIPKESREALWEALGEPARMDVPFGHYSTIFALEWVVAHSVGFANETFDRPRERALAHDQFEHSGERSSASAVPAAASSVQSRR